MPVGAERRGEGRVTLPGSCLEKTVRFTKITSSDVSLYEGRERRLTVIKTPPQGSLEGQQGVGFSLKQGSLDSPWVVVML